MAGITVSEVKHVANLSRLTFDEQELQGLTSQLNDILGYIGKLEGLDTQGVPPTTHAMKLVNVLREDEVRPSMANSEAVANAPEKEERAFVVPRII